MHEECAELKDRSHGEYSLSASPNQRAGWNRARGALFQPVGALLWGGKSGMTWLQRSLANSQSTPSARIVLAALCAGCSADGVCCISSVELQRYTGCSECTVRRGIRELEARGEIEVMAPAAGRSKFATYRISIQGKERFGKRSKRVSPAAPLRRKKGIKLIPFTDSAVYRTAHAPEDILKPFEQPKVNGA